jgi:hypothetical protein
MRLVHSSEARGDAANEKVSALLNTIREEQLRAWVERIAVPRHFVIEAEQNRATARWLEGLFQSWGYRTQNQGPHANIVALPESKPVRAILVGAHYDTVPESPGADDNGSAVAALLGCAAACSLWRPELPVIFVAFNREEEHLTGSSDFVASWLPESGIEIECAHVLEMVGFASSEPGSQKVPTGLPIKIPDRADFLGLLATDESSAAMECVIKRACTYLPDFPVIGLKVQVGIERVFPVLARSDHVPFWQAGGRAVMWTDTSEFRNPNYHTHRDLPDTLNYTFLANVTRLLTASVIEQASGL